VNERARPTEFEAALRQYRKDVDAIDLQLLSLLARRFAITREIGELKAAHRVPAADPEREQAQLERLFARSELIGLATEATRVVFEALFALVRKNHAAVAANANGAR